MAADHEDQRVNEDEPICEGRERKPARRGEQDRDGDEDREHLHPPGGAVGWVDAGDYECDGAEEDERQRFGSDHGRVGSRLYDKLTPDGRITSYDA